VPISEAPGEQINMRMVPDGSGGAIIVWEDYRNGEADIYAQKIDENGEPKWTPIDGVVVSTASSDQLHPVIVGDGSGGAIIAWQDYRSASWDIYALRISSDTGGTYTGWTDNGMPVIVSTTENEEYPEIVSVGPQGAVIVWQGNYLSSDYWIGAERMDGSGTPLWGGVIVSTGTAFRGYPKIIKSDSNNVIVTWQDGRNGDYDIYAQRMDISTGAPYWYISGSSVTIAPGDQLEPQIVSDGDGGAIITWTDDRETSTGLDIYAQRISSSGAQGWTPDGVPICEKQGEQYKPVIVEDIGGATPGAIIMWEDMRSGDVDLYAERVDRDNPPVLDEEDIFVVGGPGPQLSPRLVSDGQGGGIGTGIEDNRKIFAQKRGEGGNLKWSILVCEGTEIWDSQIISDGYGGAIVAWQAIGTSGDYDIFAQRVVDYVIFESASISGKVVRLFDEKGITGVEVEALENNNLVSSDITDTNGDYELTVLAGKTYLVRATWEFNGIISSVSKEASAPYSPFDFTLEIEYELGTIVGSVSGVEKKYMAGLSCPQSKRLSGSGLQKSLSPGNGIAFVELEQRSKVIVRVPVETNGNYSIPNLLPGRFVARAYNGTIYSNPRTVNLKEGETLRVNFVFGIIPEEEVYNYPNPAKSEPTTIRYYCGYSDPEAEIKIYNIAGELVREVGDSEITYASENIYKFSWDCKNSSGKGVASGVYIYIVEVRDKNGSGSKKVVKRMAVIR